MRSVLVSLASTSLFVLTSSGHVRAEETIGLQPYQMVRSLQLLQDGLAAGDHAALPMQKKLLELIDAKLLKADSETMSDPRNFRAALVYGMSGGNPATVGKLVNKLKLDADDKKLGLSVLAYLDGRSKEAQMGLGSFDPKSMPAEIGGFLALVKGSVNTPADPAGALALFDTARLLSPGTLIEEAALRRSMAIEASLGMNQRFFRASDQYVRRFLRSPYASQFADSFVNGIITLKNDLDYAAIDSITGLMDPEQRKVIYLRLARRAAIEGLKELLAFASERAEQETASASGAQDARAELYASLSTLTSENVRSVMERLQRIDRKKLSANDLRLLRAAEAIADEVTVAPKIDNTLRSSSIGPNRQAKPAPAPIPELESQKDEPVADAPLGVEATDAAAHASSNSDPAVTSSQPAEDSSEKIMNAARAKLDAIDKMLEEAK